MWGIKLNWEGQNLAEECNVWLGGAIFHWGAQYLTGGRKLLKARGRILTELNFGGDQLPSIAIWLTGHAGLTLTPKNTNTQVLPVSL